MTGLLTREREGKPSPQLLRDLIEDADKTATKGLLAITDQNRVVSREASSLLLQIYGL